MFSLFKYILINLFIFKIYIFLPQKMGHICDPNLIAMLVLSVYMYK